jgi:hypothetical protein
MRLVGSSYRMNRVTGRSFMIRLCAIACAAAAVISLWPAGLDVRTEDQNRDGRPDIWRVYNRRGQIATVSVDTNFDGRSDVREYYDDGALVRRESDRDFNDQIDLVQEFDAVTRESVRSVTDVDFDGSADLLVLFDGGRPVYSKWRPGFTRADSGGSRVHSSELPRRTADDRMGSLQDPFSGDLAIRAVSISPGPGDYVGTAQSGGLPGTGEDATSPLAAAPRLSGSAVSLPSSAALIPHSPRGPPARLFS